MQVSCISRLYSLLTALHHHNAGGLSRPIQMQASCTSRLQSLFTATTTVPG